MGKKDKGKGAKADKKDKKEKTPVIDWRQKLEELNINTVYENRTCEVFLFIESNEVFYEVVTKFAVGSQLRPESPYKIIRNIDILNDIRYYESKEPSNDLSIIYKVAREEAEPYVDSYAPIPLELLSKLIKLKIIDVLTADVNLMDPPILPKKNESQMDKRRKSSILNTGDQKLSSKGSLAKEVCIKNNRHLYILLGGFYEFDLIEYLFKIDIKFSAILEIIGADDDYVSEEEFRIPESASVTEDTFLRRSLAKKRSRKSTVDQSCQVPFVFSSFTSELVPLFISSPEEVKIEGLIKFWQILHEVLEGNVKSECLVNTAHLQVPRVFEINLEVLDDYDEQSIKTFEEIILEVQKIVTLQKEYDKYLNSLKIYNLDYKPKMKSIEKFKTYRLLADVIPPECFTIEVILNCVVEEVCSRVSTRRKRKSVVITNNTSIFEDINQSRRSTIISNAETIDLEVEASRRRSKKKTNSKTSIELKEWLKECVHMISPHHVPIIESYEYPKLPPKTRLKIRERSFEIHCYNEIHKKAYCYPQISNGLINMQLEILTHSHPVVLLTWYKRLSFANSLIIKNQVQTWAKSVGKTEDEMRYIITTIAFENLACQTQKLTLPEHKSLLQLALPERSYAKEESTVLTQIKYISTPARSPTIESTPQFMPLPILRYSINANVYESRNIRGYQWFEQLNKAELLQSLSRARKRYLCLDHRYCPFNDSILFRYHNRTDLFGINIKIWKKYIYSPVGFKDFCKYVYHQENYKKCFGSTAYNISNDRVQLHGTTTVFHSIDGCKVMAEQTNFIGRPTALTVSISVNSHYLILECRKTSKKRPFHFHFSLEDGTIIVLKKVSEFCKTGLKVAECVTKKPESPRPKPFTYDITEHVGKKFRIIRDTIADTEPRALTRTELQRFTNECTCWFDDPISCSFCKNLFATPDGMEGEIYRQERKMALSEKYAEEFNEIELGRSKRKRLRERACKTITNIPASIESDDDDYCRKRIRKPKPRTYPNVFFQFKNTVLSLQEVLVKINLARKVQIPLFKVCSSRLRKFSYMVPCKSTITIEIEDEEYTILCSHPRYKIKREVKVVKIEPCRLPQYNLDHSHWYDMTLSLPTGLVLHTMPSLDEGPFNIKQEYIDKGPTCQSILEERSRTFMRDGRVVIKKFDGTINIIGNGGIHMYCDLPYHATSFRAKNRIRETLRKCTLEVDQFRLTQRQRLINYIVRTRVRHVIGSHANRHFKKSRLQTHFNRVKQHFYDHSKHTTLPKTMYYVRESKTQFTYTNQGGIKITITDKTLENNCTYQNDGNNQEIFYEKSDGVKCILHSSGKLLTEFPNGTRITSTLHAILVEEFDDCDIGDIPTSDIWILINMTYKFEHPNYITIKYDNTDFHSDIILQNNVNILISERGEYTVNVQKDLMRVNVNRDSIKLYSTNCTKCKQNFNALINITPLFNELDFTAKEYEVLRAYDTYDKMFSIFADGVCFKNSNFIKTRANKFKCLRHDQLEHQKLFVMNRDLSGYKLWDAKGLQKLLRGTRNNPLVRVTGKETAPSYKRFGYKFLKIETQIDAASYKLYNTTLENPDFLLKIHQRAKFQLENYLAVTNIHFIYKPLEVYNFEDSIHDACGLDDNCPFTEKNSMKFMKNLIIEVNRARGKKFTPYIVPIEILETNLEKALSLCQRWYAWHKYYDKCSCACRIHDSDIFPPLASLNSDFTISSRDRLACVDPNKTNQNSEGFQAKIKRYSEAENLLNILKNVSDCELAREKWDLLENLSNNSKFSDDELLQFIHESFTSNFDKSISDARMNLQARDPDLRDLYSPGSNNLLQKEPEIQSNDSDSLSREAEGKCPTREVFARGMEKHLKKVAEEKERIREELVEIIKRDPCDIDDSDDVELLYRRNSYDMDTLSTSGMNAYNSSMFLKPPLLKKLAVEEDELSNNNKNFACTASMKCLKQKSSKSVGCKTKSTQNSSKWYNSCEFTRNLYKFVNEDKKIETLYKSNKSTCSSSQTEGKLTSSKSLPNPQKNTSCIHKTTTKKPFYNYSKETSTASGRSSLKVPRPTRNKSRS